MTKLAISASACLQSFICLGLRCFKHCADLTLALHSGTEFVAKFAELLLIIRPFTAVEAVCAAFTAAVFVCPCYFPASPSNRRGVLLLIVDGSISLLQQHVQLFLQPVVLLLSLVQTTQVCVVTGCLFIVAFPQSLVVTLHGLQLVHSCVIQLVEDVR